MSELKTYNPRWERDYEREYRKLKALKKNAFKQAGTDQGIEKGLRDEFQATIARMRHERWYQFKTVEQLAKRMINIVKGKAALNAYPLLEIPEAASFKTISAVREFYVATVKDIQNKPRKARVHSLPVLPAGEDGIFSNNTGFGVISGGVDIPDLDGGFAMVVTLDQFETGANVCVSSPDKAERFEKNMPRIADILMERLFPNMDADSVQFYVHNPIGHGGTGHEQFWHYDMAPNAMGEHVMRNRISLPLIPYSVAYKTFAGPENDYLLLQPDRTATASFAEMWDDTADEQAPVSYEDIFKPRMN